VEAVVVKVFQVLTVTVKPGFSIVHDEKIDLAPLLVPQVAQLEIAQPEVPRRIRVHEGRTGTPGEEFHCHLQ
jgi:hypothetical protein